LHKIDNQSCEYEKNARVSLGSFWGFVGVKLSFGAGQMLYEPRAVNTVAPNLKWRFHHSYGTRKILPEYGSFTLLPDG
jgi:hypothetical protein